MHLTDIQQNQNVFRVHQVRLVSVCYKCYCIQLLSVWHAFMSLCALAYVGLKVCVSLYEWVHICTHSRAVCMRFYTRVSSIPKRSVWKLFQTNGGRNTHPKTDRGTTREQERKTQKAQKCFEVTLLQVCQLVKLTDFQAKNNNFHSLLVQSTACKHSKALMAYRSIFDSGSSMKNCWKLRCLCVISIFLLYSLTG